MYSFSLSQSIQDKYFCIRIWLVCTLIASAFLPAFTQPATAAPEADIFQTIEDFISLGANTVREIDKAIEQAGYEMRATLEQLRNEINSMIQTLSETYQDNLNITLESLDGFTRNRIMELQVQMEKINAEIQKDITLASQAAKDVIQEASRQIHRTAIELEESLKNVLYFGGETVAYVVDRAVHNAILIISIVLFGLGLLLFIFLLFTRRMPEGFAKPLLIGFMAARLCDGIYRYWIRGQAEQGCQRPADLGSRSGYDHHRRDPRAGNLGSFPHLWGG
jgi:septum formation topological specificity factor MinE